MSLYIYQVCANDAIGVCVYEGEARTGFSDVHKSASSWFRDVRLAVNLLHFYPG